MTLLMIALGAALGAPARYLSDRAIQSRHETVFPWGTLTVNLVASFVLGIVTGAGSAVNPNLALLIGTGFCGALSTYSTFSYETLRLAQDGARFYAGANVCLSLVAAIGAAALGWSVGVSLT
ncbi:MAG: fluoride efflux transporter CrcB [Actinomycetota bacterium]|nr:fluoride efflux transporter CrcB [Actinomycetota bacterium]